MVEHTVIVESIGGATVLSCEALQFKNIEYGFSEVTPEGIKKRVLEYKMMSEKNADFDLVVVDNRPEPRPYHEIQAEESKIFKKSNNSMSVPK